MEKGLSTLSFPIHVTALLLHRDIWILCSANKVKTPVNAKLNHSTNKCEKEPRAAQTQNSVGQADQRLH